MKYILDSYVVEVSNFQGVSVEEIFNLRSITSATVAPALNLFINLPDSFALCVATLKPYFLYSCMTAT